MIIMRKIEIYEPAMCCPTGVCAPSVDQELLTITAITKEVNASEENRIYRRNLSQNPQAFVRSEVVNQKLKESGVEGLPLTLVDGQVYLEGKYPTIEQIRELTGLKLEDIK